MLSVIESIRAAAAENAVAPVVLGSGRYLSYGDFADKIARISNHFADRRIPPRSKVFLNFADPDLRLITILACLHYGLIPFILMDVKDVAAKVDHDFVIGSLRPFLPDMPLDLVIDQTVLEGRLADPTLRDFPALADDDVLYVGVTGGTTGGKKKLFVQRAGPFRIQALDGPAGLDVTAGDRVAFTVGDMTKFGFSSSLRILQWGGVIVRRLPDPVETLKLFNLVELTHLIATPIDMERLVDAMEQGGIRCPSVRTIALTGGLFHKRLVERAERRFGDAEIHVLYGASEVGRVASGRISAATFRTGYVGEVVDGVKIVGSGSAAEPAPLQLLNDRGIFCDYYSGGEITRVSQDRYAVPDLGYVEGNSLYLVGRDDEVFNLSGKKFPYSLIAEIVREASGVRDAGVVGAALADDPLGVLIAFVGDGNIDVGDLADRVCKALEAPSAREHFYFLRVDAIPRNTTGKMDRQAVLQAYANRQALLPISAGEMNAT